MMKKLVLAAAVAASLLWFGGLVAATPADAAPAGVSGRSGPPHILHPRDPGGRWHTGPRHTGPRHVGPRHGWHGGHGHHWRGGWYGGWRGGVWIGGSPYWAYPPGVYGYYYGDSCWLKKRKVRVMTDYGLRWRWRTVRVCS
jgi:hypothetical protein